MKRVVLTAHGCSRRPEGTPYAVQERGQTTAGATMGCCVLGYAGSLAIVVTAIACRETYTVSLHTACPLESTQANGLQRFFQKTYRQYPEGRIQK